MTDPQPRHREPAVAHGSGPDEAAIRDDDGERTVVVPDFVREAIEAYRKAHPRQADAVDEALARGVTEDSEAASRPASDGESDPSAASEQLDLEAGRAERDAAMARVERAADPHWRQRAWHAVVTLCEKGEPFTSDDIWLALDESPSEPRALGPIIRRAVERGMIVRDGERQSQIARRHARPIAVWRPS
jgi:hypothetical protein